MRATMAWVVRDAVGVLAPHSAIECPSGEIFCYQVLALLCFCDASATLHEREGAIRRGKAELELTPLRAALASHCPSIVRDN